MSITREKTSLDKKPTWFLFLGANVVVLLGCAITWIMIARSSSVDLTLLYLPTLICNLVSMVLAGVFGYFEIKDFAPQVMHFRKKWLRFYVAAFAIYVAAILYNVLFFLFCIGRTSPTTLIKEVWQLAIYFGITGLLTLVSIGFQRYARFRIDLDVYRRKHGENEVQKEADKNQENGLKNDAKIEPKKDQKNDQKLDKKSDKKDAKKSGASGGLLDQME